MWVTRVTENLDFTPEKEISEISYIESKNAIFGHPGHPNRDGGQK